MEFLLHLLTPRQSNNHRARALHLSSISFYITVLLVFQIALTAVSGLRPGVLGFASNITVNDLLNDTNNKRAGAGAGMLSLNDDLTRAAQAKAADMFANQYWAHNSPSGRDPWSFIVAAGYNYLFAGENLARDFGDSQAVVDAWMNSPSHRDNLLNSRYQDVGFAVVNGKFGSDETTLVVQMFGAKPNQTPSVEAPKEKVIPTPAPIAPPTPPAPPTPVPEITPTVASSPAQVPPENPTLTPPTTGIILNTEVNKPVTSVLGATRGVSTLLIIFLMGILVVDGLLVYKRRTVRLSGHNLAHLLILIAVLVALNLIGRGVIL